MRSLAAGVLAAIFVFGSPAFGQWAKSPDPSLPRTSDGTPDLSGSAPKDSNGKPNLSGVWLADPDPAGKPGGIEEMVFSRYFVDVAADLPPDAVPFQPWAAELFKERLQSGGKNDPGSHCKPTGVPAINSVPVPYKIVQSDRLVMILYEENTVFRQIFLDSRKPVEHPEPRWMGYSTGKWEGDTLVVDTTGLEDRHWLDRMGHPHSDALHLIERFRRRDAGHLEIEITIDDPKTYTKPITYTQTETLQPDEDLLEYFCTENEKDVQHFQ